MFKGINVKYSPFYEYSVLRDRTWHIHETFLFFFAWRWMWQSRWPKRKKVMWYDLQTLPGQYYSSMKGCSFKATGAEAYCTVWLKREALHLINIHIIQKTSFLFRTLEEQFIRLIIEQVALCSWGWTDHLLYSLPKDTDLFRCMLVGGGRGGQRSAGTILILRGDSVIQVIFSTKKVANHKVIIIYLQGDEVVLFKHLRNSY